MGAALLAIYFSDVSGSYGLAGTVFAVSGITQLLAEIPTGVLSDRIGRKPVLVLGAASALAFSLCYALGLSYWLLLAGAILDGLARAFLSGNTEAMLHDLLTGEGQTGEFPRYFGQVRAAEDLAYGVAAVLGGAVAAAFSVQAAFWFTVPSMALALGISFWTSEPASDIRRFRYRRPLAWSAFRAFIDNPKLRLLAGAAVLREALGESAFQFRPVFFQTLWPLWAIGGAQTGTFLASSVSFLLGGRVVRRLGAIPVMVADVIMGRFVSIAALLLPTVASPALMSSTSLTYGASLVASNSLLQREFDDARRATMGSINSQLENLGQAIGMVVVGVLADWMGIVDALVATQVLFLGTLGLFWMLARSERRE